MQDLKLHLIYVYIEHNKVIKTIFLLRKDILKHVDTFNIKTFYLPRHM